MTAPGVSLYKGAGRVGEERPSPDSTRRPGNLSFAVLMVTYNHYPDESSLRAAMDEADRLIIVDNSTDPDFRERIRQFAASNASGLELIQLDANLGVSKAYNLGLRRARETDAFWVMFLDHDATFDHSLFRELRSAWAELEERGERVRVLAPIVADDPSVLGDTLGFGRKVVAVQSVLTSGLLTNLAILDRLGGLDEHVFADGVGLDVSLRARQGGGAVFRLNRVLIVQRFGESPRLRGFVGSLFRRSIILRSLLRLHLGITNGYRIQPAAYSRTRLRTMSEDLQQIGLSRRGSRSLTLVVRALYYLERLGLDVAERLGVSR